MGCRIARDDDEIHGINKMKYFIFFGFIFLNIQVLLAQDTTKVVLEAPLGIEFIESKPEYPGGMDSFYKHISSNFKPPVNKDFKGGKIIVTFVIEKDGSITDIKIVRDLGFGTGKESIRVLKKAKKWKPGEQNGKKVRVQFALPISLSSN